MILFIPVSHSAINLTQGQSLWQDNLIFHLPIDEDVGTLTSDIVGGSDGEIFGATWVSDETMTYLEFDGQDDYVSILSPPERDNNEITISVFVNYFSYEGGWSRCIITQDNLSVETGGTKFQLSTLDGKITWLRFGDLITLRSLEVVELNTWLHIAISFDSQYHRMWINGELQAELEGTLPIMNETPIDIGRKNIEESYFYFDGLIDEVKIFDVALIEDEVVELYTQGHSLGAETIIGPNSNENSSSNDPDQPVNTELDFNLNEYAVGFPVVIMIIGTVFLIRKKSNE